MKFKGVDLFRPLKGKTRAIADSFCEVLGEQYRPVIESRLSSARYFCVGELEYALIDFNNQFFAADIKFKDAQKTFFAKFNKSAEDDLTSEEKLDDSYLQYVQAKEEYDMYNNVKQELALRQSQHEEEISKQAQLKQLVTNQFVKVASVGGVDVAPEEVDDYDIKFLADCVNLGKDGFIEKVQLDKAFAEDIIEVCDLFNITTETFADALFTEEFNEKFEPLKYVDVEKRFYKNFLVQETFDTMKEEGYILDSTLVKDIASYIANPFSELGGFARKVLKEDRTKTEVCFLPTALTTENHIVAHELGHIIDSVSCKKGSEELTQSGFYIEMKDYEKRKIYDVTYDDEGGIIKKESTGNTNKYYSFNEIFNDYISFLVVDKLKEKGVSIGFGEIKPDIECYAEHIGLFKPLFDEFFKEFVECKMNDDLYMSIKKYVGFENFNKLSRIAYALLEEENITEQEIRNVLEDITTSMREINNIDVVETEI